MQIRNIRFLIAAITTFSAYASYVSRVNLSIAIIAMVDNSTSPGDSAAAAATADHKLVARDASMQTSTTAFPGRLADVDERLDFEASALSSSLQSTAAIPMASDHRRGAGGNGRLAVKLSILPPESTPTATATSSRKRDWQSTPPVASSNDTGKSLLSPALNPLHSTVVAADQHGETTIFEKKSVKSPLIGQEKFRWSQVEQGQITGAFFYGYILFQIPGARMAESIGAKWIIMASSAGSAVISLAFPLSTQFNSIRLLMVLRFLMGLCQSAFFPAAYVLFCRWLPESERSILLTVMFLGSNMGSISTLTVSSYLCSLPEYGWPSTFYLCGFVCLLCSLLWLIFGSSNPSDNWFITQEERHYIELCIYNQNKNSNDNKDFLQDSADLESHLTGRPLQELKLVQSATCCGDVTTQQQQQQQVVSPQSASATSAKQQTGIESALVSGNRKQLATFMHPTTQPPQATPVAIATELAVISSTMPTGGGQQSQPAAQSQPVAGLRSRAASNASKLAARIMNKSPVADDETAIIPVQTAPDMDWCKLLKSVPVWTLVFSMYGNEWSNVVFGYVLPTYLNGVLHLPIEQNGVINGFFQLSFAIASPFMSTLGTWMLDRRLIGMQKIHLRKLFQSLATFGQLACFLSVPICGRNKGPTITFMFLAIVFRSCSNFGDIMVPGDLSPEFAGTIFAFANAIGNTAGFIAPYLAGVFVTDPHSQEEWRPFWLTTAAIMGSSGLIFLLLGVTNKQDLAKDPDLSKMSDVDLLDTTASSKYESNLMADFESGKRSLELKENLNKRT